MSYHNHSIEGWRGQCLTPGGLALWYLRPSAILACDGRCVDGQLVVPVALDCDVLPMEDGGPNAQVGDCAHYDVWDDAGRIALW